MKTETCAYKPLEYYGKKCLDCTGRNPNKLCYSTIHSLQEHLDEFQRIFDKPKLEEITETN